MDFLNFNSIEDIPGITARAAFLVNSSTVFKEDGDITSVHTVWTVLCTLSLDMT